MLRKIFMCKTERVYTLAGRTEGELLDLARAIDPEIVDDMMLAMAEELRKLRELGENRLYRRCKVIMAELSYRAAFEVEGIPVDRDYVL